MNQAEALATARQLYDRLYRDLRAEVPETGWAALDGVYRAGSATLETLAQTAADLPLSSDIQELLSSYLEGPADDDVEGRHAWLTLLPELLVDIRRAEELKHASLLGSVSAQVQGSVDNVAALGAAAQAVEAALGTYKWADFDIEWSKVDFEWSKLDIAWPTFDHATFALQATDFEFITSAAIKSVVHGIGATALPERGSEEDIDPPPERNRQFALAA